MNYLLAFAFFVGIYHVRTADDFDLPDYMHQCDLQLESKVFQKCVREEMEKSLPYFTKGILELGVPSIDPVDLNDISINGNGLNLTFTNAQMHGLSKTVLSDLEIELGEENEKFNLAFVANLSLTAKYTADGKILILPIKGDGDALIECKNVEVEIASQLSHVKGDSGHHFKLIVPNFKYKIQSTTFDFKNLFNGNKQLADTTIQFANQNWEQLMDDLAPPVIKQIVKTIVKTVNKFFSKITINRMVKGYTKVL